MLIFVFMSAIVIDFCLARHLVCDQETNYQSLRLTWASKTNCNQRKGTVLPADTWILDVLMIFHFHPHILIILSFRQSRTGV